MRLCSKLRTLRTLGTNKTAVILLLCYKNGWVLCCLFFDFNVPLKEFADALFDYFIQCEFRRFLARCEPRPLFDGSYQFLKGFGREPNGYGNLYIAAHSSSPFGFCMIICSLSSQISSVSLSLIPSA